MNILKSLREARGLSQGRLADSVGVDRTTVNKWESGESTPPVKTLVRLADFLNTSTDEILGRKPPRVIVSPRLRPLVNVSQDLDDVRLARVQEYALFEYENQKKAPAIMHGANQAYA